MQIINYYQRILPNAQIHCVDDISIEIKCSLIYFHNAQTGNMATFNQRMLNDTKFDWQHKFTFDVNKFSILRERNGNSHSKMIQKKK